MKEDLTKIASASKKAALLSLVGGVIAIISLIYSATELQVTGSVNEATTIELERTSNELEAYKEKEILPEVIQKEIPELPQYIIEERPRVREFYQSNDHCQSARSVNWNVTATEGWEIDVNTIKVKVTSSRSGTTFHGVKGATPMAFTISGTIKNNGACGPFGAIKDGRGTLGVVVNYVEMRQIQK